MLRRCGTLHCWSLALRLRPPRSSTRGYTACWRRRTAYRASWASLRMRSRLQPLRRYALPCTLCRANAARCLCHCRLTSRQPIWPLQMLPTGTAHERLMQDRVSPHLGPCAAIKLHDWIPHCLVVADLPRVVCVAWRFADLDVSRMIVHMCSRPKRRQQERSRQKRKLQKMERAVKALHPRSL